MFKKYNILNIFQKFREIESLRTLFLEKAIKSQKQYFDEKMSQAFVNWKVACRKYVAQKVCSY